jgi:hypothetical protein
MLCLLYQNCVDRITINILKHNMTLQYNTSNSNCFILVLGPLMHLLYIFKLLVFVFFSSFPLLLIILLILLTHLLFLVFFTFSLWCNLVAEASTKHRAVGTLSAQNRRGPLHLRTSATAPTTTQWSGDSPFKSR